VSALIELPAAMASYAWGTRGDHFAEFCAEHVVQSVDIFDGEPLALEDWQGRMMAEALAVDEDGAPYWRSVAIVLPRKNGKTALLAAYALYSLLEFEGSPEILLAAASDKQAGRLFDAVCAYTRQSAELAGLVHLREWTGEIARADGRGRILRMASSPERLHGYNPSLVVADEVAQWTTPTLRRAWAALTTGGGARSRAQTFTISTAGESHERATGILGRMIDANEAAGDVEALGALRISRNGEARTLIYNWSAEHISPEAPEDADAIRAANPASWITGEYLRRQAENPELMASEYLQLHGNVWATAEDAWLSIEQWRALARPRPLEVGERVALGFDGARFDDATALVACALDDGHLTLLDLWEKPPGAAGRGWEVPADGVDMALAAAFERYSVVRCYVDPPLWQTEVAAWQRDYSVVFPWQTNRPTPMAAAVERFRTDVLAGRLTHDDDERLTRHVGNARVHRHRAGYWLEKAAPHSPDKIDAAIAAVLAYEARADELSTASTRSRVPVSWN
jgi:phage terminase large subunit-like protein